MYVRMCTSGIYKIHKETYMFGIMVNDSACVYSGVLEGKEEKKKRKKNIIHRYNVAGILRIISSF